MYNARKKDAKKAVAEAEARAYKELYEDLDTAEGVRRALRIAQLRDKNSKNVFHPKLIKHEDGTILTEEGKILQRWYDGGMITSRN